MDNQTPRPRFRRFDCQQAGARKNKKVGIALGEVIFVIFTLVASVAAIEAFASESGPEGSSRGSRSQAVAIAHGQMTVMKGLPYGRVRPTDGFIPANWVKEPGYSTGDVHVLIEDRTNGKVLEDEIYRVSWKVRARDASQSMMDVTVRVSWPGANAESLRHVDVEGWRVR